MLYHILTYKQIAEQRHSTKTNKQFLGILVQTSNTGPIFPKMKNTCRQARQQHSLDVGIFHEG
jgi:hypothetical protein